MICPACKDPLVILEVESVELDVCPKRHGLWFDAQELTQLFELAGVPRKVLDLEARLEALPDRHQKRRCPRCGRMMEAVEDPEARATILHRCRKGHGLWFADGDLAALLVCLLGDDDEPLKRVRAFLGDVLVRTSKEKGDAS